MFNPDKKEQCQSIFDELLELRKYYYFNLYIAELREGENYEKVDSRYTKDDFSWADTSRNKFKVICNESLITPISCNVVGLDAYYYLKQNNEKIHLNHEIAMRTNRKKFTDFYCCGGINLIRICPNGDCMAGVCGLFPTIGNLYKKDGYINHLALTEYIKCRVEQCGCSSNDVIPKFRYEKDAIEYVNNYRAKIMPEIVQSINSKLKHQEDRISELINSKLKHQEDRINKLINPVAWWIPVKKWRDKFKAKFN